MVGLKCCYWAADTAAAGGDLRAWLNLRIPELEIFLFSAWRESQAVWRIFASGMVRPCQERGPGEPKTAPHIVLRERERRGGQERPAPLPCKLQASWRRHRTHPRCCRGPCLQEPHFWHWSGCWQATLMRSCR